MISSAKEVAAPANKWRAQHMQFQQAIQMGKMLKEANNAHGGQAQAVANRRIDQLQQ